MIAYSFSMRLLPILNFGTIFLGEVCLKLREESITFLALMEILFRYKPKLPYKAAGTLIRPEVFLRVYVRGSKKHFWASQIQSNVYD